MNNSLDVQGTALPEKKKSFFSKKTLFKAMKIALPVVAITTVFPDIALAAGVNAGKDLMASGDQTVGKTFGSSSSIVKWVILAEVLVGAIMYMSTKNVKFLAGFAILSVFIAVGMSVAGY